MPDLWRWWPHRDSVEMLDWLTDVQKSGTTENRLSLRDHRQHLNYNFTLPDASVARAAEAFLAQPRADWYVPVWAEATLVAGISSADVVVSCDTNADYRVGSYALIAGACDSYVIAEISAVNEGEIGLTAPVGQDYARAWVAPIRTAFVSDSMVGDKFSERGWSSFEMTFSVRDNLDRPASPFAQYDGLDLVRKCGVVKPLQFRISPSASYFDTGFGQVVIQEDREYSEHLYEMSWLTTDPAVRWTRKRWLHSVRGRDQSFWLVDWQKDIEAVGAITVAATTVDIQPALPSVAGYAGRHITFDDGALVPREIVSAIEFGGLHRLTVAALPRDLTGSKIRFLRKVRMASDAVDISHVQGFSASTSFNVVEVPQ